MVRTGLDVLVSEGFARLRGRHVGVVCNQASVDSGINHILDLLLPHHRSGFLRVGGVFGPQHGLHGHTQDNMIEWEGSPDLGRDWPVYSLYGEHREPTAEMLEGVDLMIVDLQDVGARYYTFIWTMTLCLKACERAGIPVVVLDRPNPIGGLAVEGPVSKTEFASFVGLYPLPARHGMTLGEIAVYLKSAFFPQCDLQIVRLEGWERWMHFEDTGLPWAMPSPNMPCVETAFVYPGGCLLEATNLSEGRGTTRPFEIVGAPFLDGSSYCDALNRLGLPGVKFRPIAFEPTFNKHAGEICEGGFIHVVDRKAFSPVLVAVAMLQEAVRQSEATHGRSTASGTPALRAEGATADPSARAPEVRSPGCFGWKVPPYEYEYVKRPIDILAGNAWLAPAIEKLGPLDEIEERFRSETLEFVPLRDGSLLY